MIGWTLCSGIGSPELAAPWVDWRLASEIEPFPRAVLGDRFGYKTPDTHNQGDPLLWPDMTEVTPDLARRHGIPLPDLLVAGTPCQAFSIAGLRKGTDDARGNLTLKFVETCHAIVDARPDGTLTVLWENVPGVLSDNGNAFGCFLAGLVGASDAIQPPRGQGWPGAGMVSGPRARAAWRVLDAQYFGVAQRRRRLFVVVSFGDGADPAAVLFERQSVQGHTPPRRETGQDAAGTAGKGASHWSGGPHPNLNQSHNTGGIGLSNQELFSQGGAGLGPDRVQANSGDIAYTICASAQGSLDAEVETLIAIQERAVSENIEAGPQGAGYRTDGLAYTLEARNNVQSVAYSAMPMNSGKDFVVRETEVAQPLMAAGPVGGNQGGDFVAVAFAENQQGAVRTSDVAPPLSVGGGKPGQGYPAVQTGFAVRRLTPTECERLQGYPDGHTQIEWRGKSADNCPDGPRYKACGNGMAVPNIKWIIERIRQSVGR